LMVHFTVETEVKAVRHTRVFLAPIVTPRPMKRLAIRPPIKAPEARMQVALPPLRLPALEPPLVPVQPVIEAPRIVVETVPSAIPSPKAPAQVQTGGFSGVSAAPVQIAKAPQVVVAGFGDAVAPPTSGSRRGSLVAAGFGDAQAPPSAGQRRPSPVATAGFGDTGISSAPG